MPGNRLKFVLILGLVATLYCSTMVGWLGYVPSVKAQLLSMPEETVRYTITSVNGSLWAKIDGNYPIYYSGSEGSLPMVYPTPPNTTDISVKLDGVEVSWSNYTEVFPLALHHTGIGDWAMIYTVLSPVSERFVLDIHYEHPVQVINGSYMFFYDLNISPYLSASANRSIAHFVVVMDVNFTGLTVQTVGLDESLNPINYTVTNGHPAEIILDMVSEYEKPLLGDLLVSFKLADSKENVDQENSDALYGIVLVAAIALGSAIGYFFLKRSRRVLR